MFLTRFPQWINNKKHIQKIVMDNRKIRIFIIENNPYHHQFEGWNEKLNKEDIIYLTENDYYTLKNRCNLWESLNEVLSEESGYMNGPTIGKILG